MSFRPSSPGRLAGILSALLLLASAAPVRAQVPPDSAAAKDTVPVADSLAQEVPDTVPADSVLADSLVIRQLPEMPATTPARPESGVWTWDRDQLLGEPAFTLEELLERTPGMLPLRYGDYGAPEGVMAPGLTAGRVRVFQDGFEATPLDGSLPDLSRISLGALSEVRIERAAGELRIYLTALRAEDPRPLSLVEAGTGDLRTNLFRGTFVHPRALGGSLGVSLERIDTEGTGAQEPGSRQGLWLRYGLHRGEDAGIVFELRRNLAEAELSRIPPKTTRTDWVVRGRARLADGVVAEAFTGRSSVASEGDSLTPLDASRGQHGVRLGLERGRVWAHGAARFLSAPDLPSFRADVSAGLALPRDAGIALDWSMDRWEGKGLSTRGLRAWTPSFFGLSGFVRYETGARGARVFEERDTIPPPDDGTGDGTGTGGTAQQEPEPVPEMLPTHHVSDATTLRVGAHLVLGPVDLTGAWLKSKIDSLFPLGLLSDRGGEIVAGSDSRGFQVSGRVALPVSGFALVGSLVQWQDEAVYRPKRVYQGGLDFHDVFLPSGNLEVHGGLQVQGRDPMLVPFLEGEGDAATLARVPFYQSWNVHLQIRVQTVRIFFRLENAFLHRDNQDYPDRLLPTTRSLYGVRWTLWN